MKPDPGKKQIKGFIIKKFGGLSSFCRQSGYDRYDLQKLFQTKEPAAHKLRGLLIIAKRTKAGHDPKNIDPSDLEKLKQAMIDFGGVSKFVSVNPIFNKRTVFKILSGKVKRLGPVVIELLYSLKVWVRPI